MKMKKTNTKRAHLGILVAAAVAMKDNLSPGGASFRFSEFVAKVREILNERNLKAKTVLAAMKTWLDNCLVKYNNRNLQVTPKGVPEIRKLAPI